MAGASGLKVRAASSDDLGEILGLLKSAKATVGFLPDQAVKDRIERGTLLVASSESGTVGYCLYDTPRDHVTIRQLVVDGNVRGAGIARLLVDAVVARHCASYRGIELTCRRDFEASDVWPRLHFKPIAERPGRGNDGGVLTRWFRSFGQETLLTLIEQSDDRPTAVLDSQLWVFLAEGQPDVVEVLESDWVHDTVRVASVAHSAVEMNRVDDPDWRRQRRRVLQRFDALDHSGLECDRVLALLCSEIGDAWASYEGDLTVAAQASLGGASLLVTDDRKFRMRCGNTIESQLGLRVLSLGEFVLHLDAEVRGDSYRGSELEGTDIEARPIRSEDLDDAARTFLNQRSGEKLLDFRRQLEQVALSPESSSTWVFSSHGSLFALISMTLGETVSAEICRTARMPLEPTLARQALGWLRSHACARGAVSVSITDPNASDAVVRASASEGFILGKDRSAIPAQGVLEAGQVSTELGRRRVPVDLRVAVAERSADFVEPGDRALDLERLLSPAAVLGGGVRTVKVPVRRGFAEQLFSFSHSQPSLFDRDRTLALRRQHVYFRAPTQPGLFEGPVRILWYVSSDRRRTGAPGALHGWSTLDRCVIGSVDELARRFSHLGVLDRNQIRSFADSDTANVMALQFSHTRPFREPVALANYAEILAHHCFGKKPFHAGPEEVNEAVFRQLVQDYM